MKALSIRQPWAAAILYAGKRIENRTWYSGFRGEFLLHAGQTFDRDTDLDFGGNLPDNADPYSPVNRGALLGVATITACIPVSAVPHDQRRWAIGPWCFVLANVRAFAQPIPYKGRLGFFDIPDTFCNSFLR